VFVVCLQDYAKTSRQILTKFGGKMACGPWNNSLDFGSCYV